MDYETNDKACQWKKDISLIFHMMLVASGLVTIWCIMRVYRIHSMLPLVFFLKWALRRWVISLLSTISVTEWSSSPPSPGSLPSPQMPGRASSRSESNDCRRHGRAQERAPGEGDLAPCVGDDDHHDYEEMEDCLILKGSTRERAGQVKDATKLSSQGDSRLWSTLVYQDRFPRSMPGAAYLKIERRYH